jgi:signal-transduction protein with cAMP-binding, CBS, and nucleotidyltransferase domain
MTEKAIKQFIKSLNDKDREDFKLSNKILMALTHITLTKIENEETDLGITKDEVLEVLNKFEIKDKDFDTKKTRYTEEDVVDICTQVFVLTVEGMVNINPNNIEHIHLTDKGCTVGVASFDVMRPIEYTCVYEYATSLKEEMGKRKQLRNN